jgi:DNA-binding MarR family transcriptional regulator
MTIGQKTAYELYGSLSGLLRTARALGQHRRDLGATGTSLGVLKALSHGDVRPGDLATALHVVPSVISRVIAPLEQEGLVERKVDPEDRRASLLGLTERGRSRLAQVQEVLVEQLSQTLESWSDDEVEQASAVLNRLEAALSGYQQPDAHRRQLDEALTSHSPEPTDRSGESTAAGTPPAPSANDISSTARDISSTAQDVTTTAEKVSA